MDWCEWMGGEERRGEERRGEEMVAHISSCLVLSCLVGFWLWTIEIGKVNGEW